MCRGAFSKPKARITLINVYRYDFSIFEIENVCFYKALIQKFEGNVFVPMTILARHPYVNRAREWHIFKSNDNFYKRKFSNISERPIS